MPKKTFLNLPEKKRQQFIKVTMEEFAKNGYKKGKIDNIVKKLGIAKGSIYQYFENKKELFFYILSIIQEEKILFVQGRLETKEDFFDYYKQLIRIGIQFSIKHPLFYQVAEKMVLDMGEGEIQTYLESQTEKTKQFYEQLVKPYYSKGYFKECYSLDFIVHIVSNILIQLTKHIMELLGENTKSMILKRKWESILEDQETNKLINDYISFIKSGLCK